jgi:ribosomal protein S18 acetylase RimI-like enzyme
MWVAPEARGQGVGEALIEAGAGWARSQGFKQLALDVIDDNEPAIALYQRKGFKPTGESNAFPPPREHIVEIRMVISL